MSNMKICEYFRVVSSKGNQVIHDGWNRDNHDERWVLHASILVGEVEYCYNQPHKHVDTPFTSEEVWEFSQFAEYKIKELVSTGYC